MTGTIFIVRTDTTTKFYSEQADAQERYRILTGAGIPATLLSAENIKIIQSS